MNRLDDKKFHLRRLRELEARLNLCTTHEAEAAVQKLMDAENQRWATAQQTDESSASATLAPSTHQHINQNEYVKTTHQD